MLYDHLDDFVIIYLDDVLVFLKTLKEHKKYIQKIFNRLQKKRLFVEPDKCEFYKKEIKYLEYIVREEGIKMNPDKIQVILKFPTSTCVKDI